VGLDVAPQSEPADPDRLGHRTLVDGSHADGTGVAVQVPHPAHVSDDGRGGSGRRHLLFPVGASDVRAATNASCGTSTRPTFFIFFLPSFCFSSSLRLRVMSPP